MKEKQFRNAEIIASSAARGGRGPALEGGGFRMFRLIPIVALVASLVLPWVGVFADGEGTCAIDPNGGCSEVQGGGPVIPESDGGCHIDPNGSCGG